MRWDLRYATAPQLGVKAKRMKRISLIFTFLLITACDLTYSNSGMVGKAIRHEVRVLEKHDFTLSEITDFTWDQLYLFEPYTPRNSVCKQLTIPENQCEDKIPEHSMDDGEMYIVFRNKGAIVHKEMHIRFNGDFTPINYKQPLTPSTAIFNVKPQGKSASGKPWLKLELISNNTLKRD
jgi:hypothetical protein